MILYNTIIRNIMQYTALCGNILTFRVLTYENYNIVLCGVQTDKYTVHIL